MCGQAFAEMNVIVCRNVLIYFDNVLQNKVLSLMRDSLVYRGYLVLGDRETTQYTAVADDFNETSARSRIYQKNVGAR